MTKAWLGEEAYRFTYGGLHFIKTASQITFRYDHFVVLGSKPSGFPERSRGNSQHAACGTRSRSHAARSQDFCRRPDSSQGAARLDRRPDPSAAVERIQPGHSNFGSPHATGRHVPGCQWQDHYVHGGFAQASGPSLVSGRRSIRQGNASGVEKRQKKKKKIQDKSEGQADLIRRTYFYK